MARLIRGRAVTTATFYLATVVPRSAKAKVAVIIKLIRAKAVMTVTWSVATVVRLSVGWKKVVATAVWIRVKVAATVVRLSVLLSSAVMACLIQVKAATTATST